MQQNLKLIAIIPPEPVYSVIRKEQEYIAETWGPKHALRAPPHITIIPPLALTSSEVGWLLGMAYAISGSVSGFTMDLRDYGSFKPRVLYINPIVSHDLHDLYDLWHQAILAKMPHVLEKYPDRSFHPHITLAHKDVTHRQFDDMWNHYSAKKYRASFRVEHFSILQYTGEGWVEEKKYPMADE